MAAAAAAAARRQRRSGARARACCALALLVLFACCVAPSWQQDSEDDVGTEVVAPKQQQQQPAKKQAPLIEGSGDDEGGGAAVAPVLKRGPHPDGGADAKSKPAAAAGGGGGKADAKAAGGKGGEAEEAEAGDDEDAGSSSDAGAADDEDATPKPATKPAKNPNQPQQQQQKPVHSGVKPPVKTVQIVKSAPAAEVANDGDVELDDDCAKEVRKSPCKKVKPGGARLAECVAGLIAAGDAAAESEEPNTAEDDANMQLGIMCSEVVYAFYSARSRSINANVPLAAACKGDVEVFCSDVGANGTKPGADEAGKVVACLEDNLYSLAYNCSRELWKARMAAARDYRADPGLATACAADAAAHCAGVKPGGGRVQACLREHHMQLDWACAEGLFRAELAAGDDPRLSVRLFARCLPDKKRFCAEAEPGHAAALDCLVEHRNDDGFRSACRAELDAMLERRVKDFRLDARLRRHCQADILKLCGMFDDISGDSTSITRCLQDYVSEVNDGTCRSLVQHYMALAAEDIRFNAPLADACAADRDKLCSAVPPGSAQVIRCLQSKREQLSGRCRATLFDEEVKFSENIDFQFPMKKACAKELQAYCSKVPHGNARAIRCLQENKGKKDFGRLCLKQVLAYEHRAASDYRLNHRLAALCRADAAKLCKGACKDDAQPCGGAVLRCLTDKRDELSASECRREVDFYVRMGVDHYENDVILAAACRNDVEAFCRHAPPPGEGRGGDGVHACLRAQRDKLSPACAREEFLLEQREAESVTTSPGLLRACGNERGMFCRGVPPGAGRVFRCLADHLADPDFGQQCRTEVITKLQRRQANWRLDPALRRACKDDAAKRCADDDAAAAETGRVYKCLYRAVDELAPGCRKELGRALHLALFVFVPGGIVTSVCDVDVAEACLKTRPNMLHDTGNVAECLAEAAARQQGAAGSDAGAGAKSGSSGSNSAAPTARLSPECLALVRAAAAPDDGRASFEASLGAAFFESKLAALEDKTGGAAKLVGRDAAGRPDGVTLTGWTALVGVAALAAVLVGGAAYAWRAYTGGARDAGTVVLKARPHYARVATAAT